MRCLASSATAIFTPASAYFMRKLCAPVSSTDWGKIRGPQFTSRNSFERRGGRRRWLPTAIAYQDELKCVKNALPANDPGMQKGISVRKKPFANLAGLPGFGRNIQRHVNNHGRSDDVIARDAAPETAIKRIRAVVAHDKITISGNFVRRVQFVGFAGAGGVLFYELLPVHPHGAVMNVHGVTRKTNHTF